MRVISEKEINRLILEGNIKTLDGKPVKMSESKKISAYGFRKEGAKTIIELLDEAQGYSRKFDVLLRLANKKLSSERKFNNGLRKLEVVGFVKIIGTGDTAKRIKLDKRVWDRNPDIIKLEHKLIGERLNQSGRWLSPKTLVREIRNTVEQRTKTKPSHFAVDVHLKIILDQHKHDENKNGLIRLAKFRVEEKASRPKKDDNLSLFDYVHKKSEPIAPPSNDGTSVVDNENEIDFDQDEDIFENNHSDNEYEELYDSDEDSLEGGIDQDIFGGSSIDDESKFPEETIIDENENSKNHVGANNFLKPISTRLSQKKGLHISESFNEFSIKINDITIKITYDPSRQELSAASVHDLEGIVITDALRLFGKSDMIGQLAIDTIKGIDFLVLSKRILVTKYDISEIMSMVERIIYEAIQLQKLKE